jgi:hypothetical protein
MAAEDCPDEIPGPPQRVYPGRRVGKDPKDESRGPVNERGNDQCHDNNRKWGITIQSRGWNIAYYGYVFIGRNETSAVDCVDLLRLKQRGRIDRRQFTIKKREMRLDSTNFKVLSQCAERRRGQMNGDKCYAVVLGERKKQGDRRNMCSCQFYRRLSIECKHIAACRYCVEWYVTPLLLIQ